MPGSNVLVITKENFDQYVLKSDKPVLIDFWASWCGPCGMVAPIMEKLAEEYRDKAVIAKVNVDEQLELSERFRIRSIPTVILFKNGVIPTYIDSGKNEVAEKYVGVRSKSEYSDIINRHI
jgi:thioredoxin 1